MSNEIEPVLRNVLTETNGNQGFFEIRLVDVLDNNAHDDDTKISFFRLQGMRKITDTISVKFPPTKRFRLPAFPQESNLIGDIVPSRFRHLKTRIFTLTDQKVESEKCVVFRLPDKWSAEFTRWNSLSNGFDFLKTLLGNSPDLKVKDGASIQSFTGETYDSVSAQKTILAKAALLNLQAELTIIKEPISDERSWLSFVRRIFFISRERFIGVIDPEMAQIVRTIKDNIGNFPYYKHTVAENHFGGIQAAVPTGYQVFKSKMYSIKSIEKKGNIQLTIAPAKDPAGNDTFILDADIDENGDLIKHFFDAFLVHRFSGGTHPFDIHEYLRKSFGNIELGYKLV